MNITQLQSDVSIFVQIVQKRKIAVREITNNLEKRISVVNEQLDVHSSAKQATLPSHIIKQFPNLKTKVMSNLCSFIGEEINEITKSVYRLQEIATELRKSYEKIQTSMAQLDWNEHMPYLTAFSRIAEWSETCWKCVHLLYVRYNNGLRTFHMDESLQARWLNVAKNVDGTMETKNVLEISIADLFEILQKDILSRKKIVLGAFAVASTP